MTRRTVDWTDVSTVHETLISDAGFLGARWRDEPLYLRPSVSAPMFRVSWDDLRANYVAA